MNLLYSIKNLKSDDYISTKILDSTDIFEDIHPNEVTIVGAILNVFIFLNLKNIIDGNKPDMSSLAILLASRWLADCLDGNIARKYKKTSKLGNTLDTLSDMMLWAIIWYFIFTQLGINMIYYIIIMIVFLIINIFKYNIFEDHNTIKNGNGVFDEIYSWGINNSWASFIACYYAVSYFSPK